jgi:hypothetical protein
MINEKDSVFKKHQHCRSELRFNENQQKYRMYCVEHHKWLHTLTNKEAKLYFELLDAGELHE